MDASPAAVTALPEPGLALRARRKMLPSQIASGVRWMFSFSISALLPRPPHKSPHGKKRRKEPWRQQHPGFQGRPGRFSGEGRRHKRRRQRQGSICQPLSSLPGPLKETEGSSCVFVMSWQITCIYSLLPQQLWHTAIESVCVSGSAVFRFIYSLAQLAIPWRRRI